MSKEKKKDKHLELCQKISYDINEKRQIDIEEIKNKISNYEEFLTKAIKFKYNEVFEYMVQFSNNTKPSFYEELAEISIKESNLKTLKFLVKKYNVKCNSDFIDDAIIAGNFEILQFVVENCGKIDIHNLDTIKSEIERCNNDSQNLEMLKYLLGCANHETCDLFVENLLSNDYHKCIGNIRNFLEEMERLTSNFDDKPISNYITPEDTRCVKAILNYFIKSNGLDPHIIGRIKVRITDIKMQAELIEEVEKFKTTPLEEIGKMIAPMIVDLLNTNDDIYNIYPKYKPENLFDFLINPKNFKEVTDLFLKNPEKTEKIFSELTNNTNIIYLRADKTNLESLIKKFNEIDPQIKESLQEKQSKIHEQQTIIHQQKAKIEELQANKQEPQAESFVTRYGLKRSRSESSLEDTNQASKIACIR